MSKKEEINLKQLADYVAGSRVKIGGLVWDLLEKDEDRVLCITDEIVEYKAFDEENSNDWKKSSLRELLDGKFLNTLCEEMEAKGQGSGAILEQEQDLTTDDGLKVYGSSTDKVFLLTCEQYRKYRQFIRRIEDWWWLITADSTINHFARYVNTDGSLYSYHAYTGYFGVRPACVFKSSILTEEE
jgi:hypothetical protein